MKSFTIFATGIAALSSVQARSAQDNEDLKAQLAAWKKSHAGKLAAANGFIPSNTESGKLEDGQVNDELERFAATKKIVDELNKQHPEAVFSTDNQFALLTEAEFAAYVKGSFKLDTPKRQLRSDNIQMQLTPEQQQSGSVDWSTNKCMSPVRNQGQCGSCWAFASVGAVESAHCLVTGQLLDFSEQQLVSCASSAGQGCQGGWPNKALDYIAQTGLCTESSFPYTSGDSGQNGQCTNCSKTKVSVGKSVDIQGESALQSALDKQPVTVTVEAGNNVWRNYKSGVVQSCPGAQSDHAVIAVGYGSASGQNFFKIKNSWGANWGEQGYIRLQRGVSGKGMCNVAQGASYPSMSGKPQPTSQPSDSPANDCNGCNQCYYPDGNQCLSADYDKEYC
ncbi:cysteine protease family C01A, partial [Thraustotheca clavata]